MRIDRINYQKTFNLGNYCSEKVGVEMEVEPGEANKALDEAKKFVEDWHKSNNPQLYDGSMPELQSAYDQQLKKLSIPQQSEFHINK